MPKYGVCFWDKVTFTAQVEADSEEDAIDQLEEMISQGEVESVSQGYTSQQAWIEEEDEPELQAVESQSILGMHDGVLPEDADLDTNADLKAAIIAYARENLEQEGTLELDDNPEVSLSTPPDGGGYVKCWHWVSFEDIGWDTCENCDHTGPRGDDWYDDRCPDCADLLTKEEDEEEAASHWDEDETYPVEDWKYEVANDDTRQSYAEWVTSKREAEEDE